MNDIQEAIKHCEEVASQCGNTECAKDHLQLKEWLERGLALQRLKEKLADTNKGWKPDWSSKEDKFVIVIRNYTLRVATTKHTHFVLAFENAYIATKFMWENNKLIREAYRFFNK